MAPAIGARSDDAVVCVRPGLLKRGESWSFSAVTTGPVEVAVDAPLIDTEVRPAVQPHEKFPAVVLRVSAFGVTAELPIRRKR